MPTASTIEFDSDLSVSVEDALDFLDRIRPQTTESEFGASAILTLVGDPTDTSIPEINMGEAVGG